MDLSTAAIGSSAPTGTPECVLLVPDDAASIPLMTKADYSPYQVCAPSATTGVSNRTLCQITIPPSGTPVASFPPDAMTTAPNTDANRYYYFQQDTPVPSLPMCPQ
jgi:hypothetical protein